MTKKLKIIAVIPARYGSTRFPGKPLALIAGTPMIQHVYERVSGAKKVDEVFVATDDKRIAEVVDNFGGKFVMTSASLNSGTDRCAAAARKIKADIVVNVQGDEPIISPKTIDAAVSTLLKPQRKGMRSNETVMSTAAVPIRDNDTLFSHNAVKVVLDMNGEAMYFTRSTIPFLRGVHEQDYLSRSDMNGRQFRFLKHLGIYVYRNSFLQRLTMLKETPLEAVERLEQLRVLEHGFKIKVAVVEEDTISVDVPSDLAEVEDFLSSQYHVEYPARGKREVI
jgi:3-deoxy-manno-octulosonate cytidylyltransferase (CMP-KDO synthetase)